MQSKTSYNTRQIIRCFNKAANTYDAHANIQQLAGCKLIKLLVNYMLKANNIIDIGCGSGFTTEKLVMQYPYQRFYAIDIAEQLLKVAKKRLAAYCIDIHEQDFDNYDFPFSFDLAFANMSLQWSNNLGKLLSNIHYSLENNGIVAFSIPLNETFSELAATSKNKFYSSTNIIELLKQEKFTLLNHNYETLTIYYDSWIKAFKAIKSTGANYLKNRQHKSLRGKAYFHSMINSSQTQQIKALTYHIGYFIARKNDVS